MTAGREFAGQGTAARLDRIVESFLAAWQQGQRPAIDDFLPNASSERLKALVELVATDLELRLKAGEAIRVESYLERYPELASNPDYVVELVKAENAVRRHSDPALGFGEYLRRF